MGRAVASLLLEDAQENLELAAAWSRKGSPQVGADMATLVGQPASGVVVSDDLQAVLGESDVLIDFTRPDFTLEAAAACAVAGKPLVSGTTGMLENQLESLREYAGAIAILHAPNMSVGVNLLLFALGEVARRTGEEFDAEIVESHHRHKVDAPSGTAIALGEVIAGQRNHALKDIADFGRHGREGERQRGRIGFHSIRAGEIVGEHDVRLVSAGEELRLGHTAFRREAFAAGALRAAAWIRTRQPGLYSMRDLLEL